MRKTLLAAALVLSLVAPAAAAPRVVVDVEGDDSGRVARAAKRALAGADQPLIVYGTVDKSRKKGKKKVTVRLTVTLKDGTVLGEVRVQAATREAAAARVARKLPGVLVAKADEAGPTPAKAKPARPEKAVAAKPEKPAKPVARAKPGRAPGSGSGEPEGEEEEAAEEAEAETGSAAASDVSMSVDRQPAAGAQSWLSLSVGPELVGRHFSYRDDVFNELRQYDLAGAAALGFTAEAFPLRERRDWLAALGGAARLWVARPFESDAVNGETYQSASHGYSLGARYRRMVAGVELAGALDWGSQSFTVDATGSEYESQVPAVKYSYLRPGASGRLRFLDRYSAELSLGYRHVLGTGEIASDMYFPRASARGFDLEAAVAYALLRGFDVRAGAGIEQYGFALDPEPGDERVAGGATDRYPRLFVRLGYSR